MTPLRHALAIARRELRAALHAPMAHVVLVLFLVVEGFSFTAVLKVLADPSRPAPYGAVLRTHFGGTFLYWAFLFFVAAALTMRLIAEERRQGTWETVRTVPVHEGAVVAGKWLGVAAFYSLLWLPTLVYVPVLEAFAPHGVRLDAGPVATAYLGVLISGGAFLAVGLAMSALTSSQVGASVATFVVLTTLLLLGLVPEIAPDALPRRVSAALSAVDVRHHMDDFARGVVDARHVAFYVGLGATALVGATVAAGWHRRPRRERALGLAGIALTAVAALLGMLAIARRPVRFDATRNRVYTLSDKTRAVLGGVDRPVDVLILAARLPAYAELYDEVGAVLRRFADEQPLLSLELLDPALAPGRVAELAEAHALVPGDVVDRGAVVFSAAGRTRVVAFADLATPAEKRRRGRVFLESLQAEAELAAALLDVTDDTRPEACFTSGHGEPPRDERPDGADLSGLVAALARDGVSAGELPGLADGVPARCALVAAVGPTRAFTADEELALQDYLAGGGRLLLAVDANAPGGSLATTGLEALLGLYGVRLGPAIVVDLVGGTGDTLSWTTLEGYGEHPVSAAFAGHAETVWMAPRWVEEASAAGVTTAWLVRSSATGWAETDLSTLAGAGSVTLDGRDQRGPASVAVAAEKAQNGARVVVLGSAAALATRAVADRPWSNLAFAASAVAWLTGRARLLGVGAKTPEQFRVVMSPAQLRNVFYALVLALPALAAAAGALFLWWRRRETR